MIRAKQEIASVHRIDTAPPPLPAWVGELLDANLAQRPAAPADHLEVSVARSEHFCLVTIRVLEAAQLPPLLFQQRTVDAYRAVAEQLRRLGPMHPVRCWNFIPHIHTRIDVDLDRYHVFNAGRFAAYTEWYGSPDAFDDAVPAATAIGHRGADLVIHVLAADQPGMHVHNPRQIPPHRYSRRYGPMPPCFARATVIRGDSEDRPMILLGGTASVRGETTVHVGNLLGQLDETWTNLGQTIRAACTRSQPSIPAAFSDVGGWLRLVRNLRVYYADPNHVDDILQRMRLVAPHVERMEMIRADICRAELLVEIEGLARLAE